MDANTLADELEALAVKATEGDLHDGGRWFAETCSDLTQCHHGDTGEYGNRHDGKLIEKLWNNLPSILAALRARDPSEETVERVQTAVAKAIYGPGFDPHLAPETYEWCESVSRAALRAMQNNDAG